MPRRRRHATRAELVTQIAADRELPPEHVDRVFDWLATLGVPVDALVKIEVDEAGVYEYGA